MGGESNQRTIGVLLRAMATGGDVAFGEFVSEGLPQLEMTLRNLFRRCHVSEDVLDDHIQETLLKVIKALRRSPSQEVSTAWLFCVARSVRLDRVRQLQREIPAVDEYLARDLPDKPQNQDFSEVIGMLNQLPSETKDLMMMVYFEAMTIAEAARRLGIPVETAYKRHARALDKLREQSPPD